MSTLSDQPTTGNEHAISFSMDFADTVQSTKATAQPGRKAVIDRKKRFKVEATNKIAPKRDQARCAAELTGNPALPNPSVMKEERRLRVRSRHFSFLTQSFLGI